MYNLEKFELENMLCVIKIRSKKKFICLCTFLFSYHWFKNQLGIIFKYLIIWTCINVKRNTIYTRVIINLISIWIWISISISTSTYPALLLSNKSVYWCLPWRNFSSFLEFSCSLTEDRDGDIPTRYVQIISASLISIAPETSDSL